MTVSFLYPLFLWSLFLIIIPIIIHLLQKKKIINLSFSTTLFFKESTLKKSRMRKLNKILQLIIRTLILIVLTLLFASPFKNKNPFNKLSSQNINIHCWIDQSLSMDVKSNDKSLIDIGKSIISYCDSTLPGNIQIYKNGRFTLYRNNDEISTLHNPPLFKEFISAFTEIEKSTDENNALMIITDLQTCNDDLFNYLESNDSTLILLVDMSAEVLNNLSIDSIKMIESTDNFIKTHISSNGKIKSSSVSLVSNRMRHGRIHISNLNTNDTTINFKTTKDLLHGIIKAEVDDDFIHDNELFFSKTEYLPSNVLIINNNLDFSPLNEALKTILDSNLYNIETHTPGSYSAEDLEKSDIIIINSLNRVAGTLFSLFKPGIFKNKKIIFSPSLKPEAKFTNSEILNFLNIKKTLEVTTLDSTTTFYFTNSAKTAIKGIEQKHLRELKVKRSLNTLPGNQIIRTSNKHTLLSTTEDENQNRWIVSAIPLDQSLDNNITTTGLYIPLIDMLFKYLNINNDYSKKGYYAGEVFRSPLADPANQFKLKGLTDPDFTMEFSTPYFTISKPGIYKLHNSKGEKSIIPINPSLKEMILEYKELNIDNKRVAIIKPANIDSFISKLLHGNFEKQLIFLLLILILADLYFSIYLAKKSK